MSLILERSKILYQIRIQKDNLKSRKDDFMNEITALYEWLGDKNNNISGHGINDSMQELNSILQDIRRIEFILKELDHLNEMCHY
jgi:hypothetical protein